MNPKNTWLWVLVAAGLFGIILLNHRLAPTPQTGPARLLPGFEMSAVQSVEILPADQRPIRAERADGVWQLTEPVKFPGASSAITNLLAALERAVPTTRISAEELGNLRDANEKYGFNPPTFTVILQPGDLHIQVGNKNGPGAQVFVKVVGRDGVAVVDAGLLSLIPRTVDAWRDTALVDFAHLDFDQIYATNGSKILELHRNLTNGLWRMELPSPARADRSKIFESLEKLAHARTARFIELTKPDLDAFGLQPPEISLAFKRGTNMPLLLVFGKSPTNDATQVFVRRNNESTVMIVAGDVVEPWHAAHETFRDRHLLSAAGPLSAIEFRGLEDFTLRRTNRVWMVTPQNFPADSAVVSELLTNLGGLQVEFYKDVVVGPDLPALGLAEPSYRILFYALATNSAAVVTNLVVTEMDFGTNQDEMTYARRLDESAVYKVRTADYLALPIAAIQLRERAIWNFSTNDVTRISVQQNGKTRQWIRKGPGSWSLAPGSQGIMGEFTSAAIEETVYRFGYLSAEAWVERGDQNRARYGFQPEGLRVTIELQKGQKFDVQFGGQASVGSPYALVTLNQEPWVFEFPPMLYQLVLSFLAFPPETR